MMIRNVLLAAGLLPLAISGQSQPDSPPQVVGRCIVITVQSGSQPPSPPPAYCTGAPVPDNSLLQTLSKWAPPFLELAYHEAEESLCSSRGCATGSREVRIVVLADGTVNAGVTTRLDGGIDFTITSGAIDFTSAAATAFVKEIVAATKGEDTPRGFNWWLDTMRSFGGKPCRGSLPWPDARVGSPEDFLALSQAPAQSVHQLVFGHELAHLRSGGRCGAPAGASALDVEAACDRMALDGLSRRHGIMPVVGVAWLTAVDFYESLLGAAAIGRPAGDRTVDFFPARDWRIRSERLLTRWEELCSAGVGKGATCLAGWEAGVDEGRRLLALTPPSRCTPPAIRYVSRATMIATAW